MTTSNHTRIPTTLTDVITSLRNSGKIVGRSASIRQVARQCNLSFPLSSSSAPLPIHLHPAVVSIGAYRTHAPFDNRDNAEPYAEVYGTAGIGVGVASRENLTPAVLGNTNFTILNDLDVEACSTRRRAVYGPLRFSSRSLFLARSRIEAATSRLSISLNLACTAASWFSVTA